MENPIRLAGARIAGNLMIRGLRGSISRDSLLAFHPRRRHYRNQPRILAPMGQPDRRALLALAFPLFQQSGASDADQSADIPPASGRLVVIMDGPTPPKLNVVVNTDEPPGTGYAKVAVYTPVGTGGGVLTQTVVHESAEEAGATTSQYGVIFGHETTRLPDSSSATGAAQGLTEKE
jgi:hypothetical protein